MLISKAATEKVMFSVKTIHSFSFKRHEQEKSIPADVLLRGIVEG